MAHELNELAPGIHSFASANEDAWHRLGTVLSNTMTAEEALTAAHLANWNVRKTPLTTTEVTEDGVTTIEIPDRFATVYTNPVTNAVQYLGVVGTHYRPIQNEDHADLLNAIVDEGGAHFETAGSLRGGRQTFLTMKMPEQMLVGGQDAVDQYLVATNAHDGNGAFRFLISPVRVVCANTLTAAIGRAKGSFSIRHTTNGTNRVQEAREALGLTWKYLEAFQTEADKMANATMTDDAFEAMMRTMYGVKDGASTRATNASEKHLNALLALWSGGGETMANVTGTRWGAFQAVTEYIDHHQDVRGDDEDARARRAISSEGIDAKQAAFDLLKVGA